MRWWWTVLPLSGCVVFFGDGDPTDTGAVDDWQLQTHLDDGEVCFTAGDGGVDVVVVLAECLSSSCSRDFAGSCEATVDGSEITLTSTLSWAQNLGEGVPCTDDCGLPQADCTIAGLADGTYDVTYGGETFTLTVPVVDTACDAYPF